MSQLPQRLQEASATELECDTGVLVNNEVPLPCLHPGVRCAVQSARISHLLECSVAGVAPLLSPPRLWQEETLDEATAALQEASLYVVLARTDAGPQTLLLPDGGLPVFADELSASVFVKRGLQVSQPGLYRVHRWKGEDVWTMCSTMLSNGRAASLVLNPPPHTDLGEADEPPPLTIPLREIDWLPPPMAAV
eukprot:TRINITY_DN11623_c0_g1_i3.p2 TRINITY_DN11623_c0_g1~~TRINITY_DN11623_c0_g1_i3.p2  ORF type:complete len:193 (+),score=65.84 TRINITY_DN11623_c0_g1_i3:450-1028(+)